MFQEHPLVSKINKNTSVSSHESKVPSVRRFFFKSSRNSITTIIAFAKALTFKSLETTVTIVNVRTMPKFKSNGGMLMKQLAEE